METVKKIFRAPLRFIYNLGRKIFGGKGLRKYAVVDRAWSSMSRLVRDDTVMVNGYKMWSDVVNGIDFGGQTTGQIFDAPLVELFNREVKPGMTVLDIGAEMGYFTCLFAKLVGPLGRIYAFEPNPHNLEYLRKNVAVNDFKNVTVMPQAASDAKGEMRFFARGPHSSLGYDRFADGETPITVKTAALDDVLRDVPRIDFMKIDIEGSEGKAFRGMQGIVKKNPSMRIVMEFYPMLLKKAGEDPRAVFDSLVRAGFAIHDLKDSPELGAPVSTESIVKAYPPTENSMTNLYLSRI